MDNKSTNNEVIEILVIIIIIITGWNTENGHNMNQIYVHCKDIDAMPTFQSIESQPEEYRDIELEYGEELGVPSDWEMDDDVMTESLSVSISLSATPSESSMDDNYDVIEYISRDEFDNYDDTITSVIVSDNDDDPQYVEVNDIYQQYQPWAPYNDDEYDDELPSEWEIDDNSSTDPFQSQQHNDNHINNDFEYPPWDEYDDFGDEHEVNDVYRENPIHIDIDLMVSQQQHINMHQDDGQFEYPPWSEYNDDEDDEDDYDGFEYPPWPEYDQQNGAEYAVIQDIEVNVLYQQEAININLMSLQQDGDIYEDDGHFEYPPWSEYDDNHNDQ